MVANIVLQDEVDGLDDSELLSQMEEPGEGLWCWPDVSKNEQYWSPRFKALLGYQLHEIDATYSNLRKLLHPEDVGDMAYAISEHINQGAMFKIDCRMRMRSGEYRWFCITGGSSVSKLRSIQHMTGLITDIHERKQNEYMLGKLQTIISDYSLELEGKLQQILQLATSYLGLSHGIIINKTNSAFAILNQYTSNDKADALSARLAAIAADPSPAIDGAVIFHNFSKSTFVCHNYYRALELEACLAMPLVVGGERCGVILLAADKAKARPFQEVEKKFVQYIAQWLACELKRIEHIENLEFAEKEMSAVVEKLSCSNENLEQFAHIASHDLQEPLRTIAGFVRQLDIEYSSRFDNKAKEYIGYISDGIQHMNSLVVGLLEHAKLDSINDQLSSVDLEQVLADVLLILQDSINESDAIISHSSLPVIQGDYIHCVRLLQNLISNAIKYSNGEAKPRVHVSAKQDEKHWVISIKDNGIGIGSENLQKIFEPLKRLHSMSEYSGNGVGLAICKKIVTSMGGKIWAESEPGSGSEFFLALPNS